MKHIKVGILGIGNVAVGTYKALEMNCRRIEQSSGVSIDIIKILNRSPEKDRGITVAEGVYTQDPADILDNPQIDIVVELIGGIEPASEYMARALRNGKHVVTAKPLSRPKAICFSGWLWKTALCFASKPASAEGSLS